jgi:hypothetical protein
VRIAALAPVLLALAGSSVSGSGGRACPRDRALGSVTFVRAGELHEVSLGDCVDRVLGPAPRPRPAAHLPGVVVRGHALWLTRSDRNVRLTQPLPEDEWPARVALSPDHRYVLWVQTSRSASISADGLPLKITRLARGGATHTLAGITLAYADYRSWC